MFDALTDNNDNRDAEAPAEGAAGKPHDEKEELRVKIRNLKAELKTIAHKMIRVRTIGDQNSLKSEQKIKQRELLKLESQLREASHTAG